MLESALEEIKTDWKPLITRLLDEYPDIALQLKGECKKYKDMANIYPPVEKIFSAFNHFNQADLKVIIIGQDPYHQKGQANGLAFSVEEGVKIPPSLRNILKKIQLEYTQIRPIKNGDLTYLAKQGVLLINRTLTVRDSQANSHQKIWDKFTPHLIKEILMYHCEKNNSIVLLLWGNNAIKVLKDMDKDMEMKKKAIAFHHIFTSCHPSPLSATRGKWFNNEHFTRTNTYLESLGKEKIEWYPEELKLDLFAN
jgi:uracil-DNA glycosylase